MCLPSVSGFRISWRPGWAAASFAGGTAKARRPCSWSGRHGARIASGCCRRLSASPRTTGRSPPHRHDGDRPLRRSVAGGGGRSRRRVLGCPRRRRQHARSKARCVPIPDGLLGWARRHGARRERRGSERRGSSACVRSGRRERVRSTPLAPASRRRVHPARAGLGRPRRHARKSPGAPATARWRRG